MKPTREKINYKSLNSPQTIGEKGNSLIPRNSQGQFISGTDFKPPGRTKGSKNKFTQIKQEIAEVWPEIQGKVRLKKFAKSNMRNFGRFVDWIVTLAKERDNGKAGINIINLSYGYRNHGADSTIRTEARSSEPT